MNIREAIVALEQFAPLSLQDGYDNAGLQIGLTEDADVSGALLSLDVTEDVLDEAVERGCNLVVSHHPLLFHAPKQITGADYVQRCMVKAIKQDITIYSAHTNLDNAPGGVSWRMAELLGLKDCHVLEAKGLPAPWTEAGAGVLGELPEEMDREDFIALVKEQFEADSVRYNSWTGERVKQVALCGGSGAFLIPKAVAASADVFLTGEIGYHRFFGLENDIQLMEIGHYESELYTLKLLHDILTQADPALPVSYTSIETNPINYL